MITFQMDDSGQSGVLTLTGEMTLEQSDELKGTLVDSLDHVNHVVLDLAGITRVDLSFLQLLCSAHRTSIQSHKQLTLARHRPEILERTVAEAGYSCRASCIADPEIRCLWTEQNHG